MGARERTERGSLDLAIPHRVLKAFADRVELIFVFSQIDRHYDVAAKALPDITDIRTPNSIDSALFNKTCFLREGKIMLRSA